MILLLDFLMYRLNDWWLMIGNLHLLGEFEMLSEQPVQGEIMMELFGSVLVCW